MISSVLIANRGEIACRIIRTLRRLGIRSIAVYSDADRDALHVRLADDAVRLGPASAAESYLSIERVLDAARLTGAAAIHPGFGFLAENAAFARACGDAGIVFIGPSPEAIEVMGDKISAKRTVAARGVPTVPGLAAPGLTDDELIAGAAEVGFPVLIKPSAGGGGKGMHVVESADAMPAALAAARREAGASFGDDTLFLERYVSRPRHIEVQIVGDRHGTVIHLGERECSLQRRHQKVIEEAPSPLLDAETRARIGEAACETARSVGYVGAGTVEFIVPGDSPGEFFFMEMNTRLQVEHPVTEQITGLDLVELQLRVAAGEPLPLGQNDVVLTGHSFEARVYAEDPRAGFLPTGGRVLAVRHPDGEGVRVDTSLTEGLDVGVDYDPMLAKIIAWGADRDEARRRLIAALEETVVLGFETNLEFLALLLRETDVARGDLDTGLIARVFDDLPFADIDDSAFAEGALVRWARVARGASPWQRAHGWRLGPAAPTRFRLAAQGRTAEVRVWGTPDAARISVDGGPEVPASLDGDTITVDGRVRTVLAAGDWLAGDARSVQIVDAAVERSGQADAASAPELVSPMPGTVVLVPAADGAHVEAGEAVVVVEAMKMEHVLRAAAPGTVRIAVRVGDAVARGAVLASVEPD